MTEPSVFYFGEIVSRSSAAKADKKRYFTGRPCLHGHIAERQARGAACVECVRLRRLANPGANYAAVKAWRAANPAKWAEQSKKYSLKYPEKMRQRVDRYNKKHRKRLLPQLADRARERRKADPEAEKIRQLRWKAKRDTALAEIAGRPRPAKCEVCNGNSGGIVFDHCHNSGEFRGWICDRCNKTLGMMKDSPKLLKKLAKYLEAANVEVDIEGKKCPADLGLFGAVSVLPN